MGEIIGAFVGGIFGILRRKYELLVVACIGIIIFAGWYLINEKPLPTAVWNVTAGASIALIFLSLTIFFASKAKKEGEEDVDKATVNEGIRLAGEKISEWTTSPPNPDVTGDLMVTEHVSIRLKTLKKGRFATIIVNGEPLPNSRMRIG